jgi:hypothetical protein
VIDVREQSEWPGTRLFGHTASVTHFDLNDESVALLKSVSNSIFGWRTPKLPEDLCLLREDESVWLGSISHERDAWLEVTESELAAIRKSRQVWLGQLQGFGGRE